MDMSRTAGPRVPLIAGNWKMFKTGGEGAAFIAELAAQVAHLDGREIVVSPPFTGLADAVRAAASTTIKVSAQNMYFEDEGAFTGEVSPGMLVDLGVSHVIIGHSERRQLFGETDEGVQKKIHAALHHGLLPIMCVGETEAEREAGETEEVIARQLARGLVLLQTEDAGRLAVAYEPIWAIGTGKTATPDQAEQMHSYIRRLLNERYSQEVGSRISILYGGSVKPDNTKTLMEKPNIDGALVGGASLKAESFAQIIQEAQQTYEAGNNS